MSPPVPNQVVRDANLVDDRGAARAVLRGRRPDRGLLSLMGELSFA
jgi:hypothetical protein